MLSKFFLPFFVAEKNHRKLLYAIYGIGVLAFALLIVLVARRTGSDDTIFQTQIQPYASVLDWLSYRYAHWSGRIFSEASVYIFSSLPLYAWKLVTITLFAVSSGILFCYYCLFTKTRNRKKDVIMLILALILPFFMDTNTLFDGIFWVTGAINYFWMTTLALFAFYPIAFYAVRRTRPHWIITLLGCISGVVAACSQEQAGLTLVGIVLLSTIYLFFRDIQSTPKKIPLYPFVFLVAFAGSLYISLTAPGNQIRLHEETLVWQPDFFTTPLPQHIDYAYRWFVDAIINHTGFLLVGSWIVMLLLFIKKQSKDMLDRFFIGGLCLVTLALLLKGFSIFSYLFAFYPTWHPQIPHRFSFLVLIPWTIALLATVAAPIVLYRKEIRGYAIAMLYTASFLGTALLTLSPTMYASGVRTLFTPSVVLIAIIYLLFIAVYDLYKRQYIETAVALACSLVIFQYALIAGKIATTH